MSLLQIAGQWTDIFLGLRSTLCSSPSIVTKFSSAAIGFVITLPGEAMITVLTPDEDGTVCRVKAGCLRQEQWLCTVTATRSECWTLTKLPKNISAVGKWNTEYLKLFVSLSNDKLTNRFDENNKNLIALFCGMTIISFLIVLSLFSLSEQNIYSNKQV